LEVQRLISREEYDRFRLTEKGVREYRKSHSGTRQEIYMGDVIKAGAKAIVINRSTIVESFNELKPRYDQESQDVLNELVARVMRSGNADAIENLKELLVELKAPAPRKSILTAFLNGMLAALPSLTAAVGIVGAVQDIIARA
jgi:hypothetical protein